MAQTAIALSLKKTSLRWLQLVDALKIAVFIFITLVILPSSLQPEFLTSRLSFQIPALLTYTFHKTYDNYQQGVLLPTTKIVTYANF